MGTTNDHIFFEDSWNVSNENLLDDAVNNLLEAKELLKECLHFMNNVPNNKYKTLDGTKDHYKVCSKVNKFIKKCP